MNFNLGYCIQLTSGTRYNSFSTSQSPTLHLSSFLDPLPWPQPPNDQLGTPNLTYLDRST